VRFMHKFSIATKAKAIALILDDEPDVSRHYAELVPALIPTADEFWGRYFFRLDNLTEPAAIEFDDDGEEEEEAWGKDDDFQEQPNDPTITSTMIDSTEENARLRAIIKTLTGRITELEKSSVAKDNEIAYLKKREQRVQEAANATSWKRPPVAVATSDQLDEILVQPVAESIVEPIVPIPESLDEPIVPIPESLGEPVVHMEIAEQPFSSGIPPEQVMKDVPAEKSSASGEIVAFGRDTSALQLPPAAAALDSAIKELDGDEEGEDSDWS
jgi:hypothetical protein